MTQVQSGDDVIRQADGTTWRFADRAARTLLAGHLAILHAALDADDANRRELSDESLETVKHNSSRTVVRCDLPEAGGFYLKIFHHPSRLRGLWEKCFGGDAELELTVSQRLIASGVTAQQVLAVGRRSDESWIVTRAVPHARLLSDLREDFQADRWTVSRPPQDYLHRRAWIRAVANLLAGMHDAGVLHLDLHAGNIMFDGRAAEAGRREPIICDLHRVALRRPGGAGRSPCARDLARLDHDSGRFLSGPERLRFLVQYLRKRKVGGTVRGWAMIIEHLRDLHAARFIRARRKRVVGDNRYFARLGGGVLSRGHALLRSKTPARPWPATRMTFTKQAWLALFEPDPPQLRWRGAPSPPGELAEGVVVKDSPSAMVVHRSLTIDERQVDAFIKYARVKHRWKLPLELLRPSRSVRAFVTSYALIFRGIPTALPLACGEYRRGGMLRGSVLITENFAGAVDARGFLEAQSRRGDESLKPAMLDRVARMLRTLHDSGFTHRDLKATNVLVRACEQAPGGIDAALIDLDGVSRRPLLGLHGRLKNLARLLVSLRGARGFRPVEDAEYFLRSYLHGCGRSAPNATLCRLLIEEMIARRWGR